MAYTEERLRETLTRYTRRSRDHSNALDTEPRVQLGAGDHSLPRTNARFTDQTNQSILGLTTIAEMVT